MKKNKKQIVLVVIALIIASLAFGYAYLTTTLSINGITDIDRNSWDVYFDNVQVTDGSVSGAQEIEAPTITSDTEVEFHVNLKKPGDFYEFTIEARNDGTIDAMINSVSKKLNNVEITTLPAYLNYKVTYEDDVEIEDNHLLAAESLETYKIRVEFKKNISASDLPDSAQSLTLSFGVEYVQADETAKKVRNNVFVYNAGHNYIEIGSTLPSTITEYDDFQRIVEDEENKSFLRITLVNDIVKDMKVGFYYNNDAFFIQGGGATYNSSTSSYNHDSIYYEENKSLLINAFGESLCSENINGNHKTYSCYEGDGLLGVSVDNSGNINAGDNYSCSIGANGKASCGAIT